MAIVIDNPQLEAQLRQAADAKGVTPEELLVTALRASGALPSESVVANLAQRLSKYRGSSTISKPEYDALYEPRG